LIKEPVKQTSSARARIPRGYLTGVGVPVCVAI
jgi:hypothetical protein